MSPTPTNALTEDLRAKRAKAKKYYVGREIGQLKARVEALERLLARSQALVLERNKTLRGLEKGKKALRRLLREWLCASDNFDLEDWTRRVRNEVEDNG